MQLSSFSLVAFLSVLSTVSAQSPEEKSQRSFRRRVVAVGDLHGDYDNTIESLQLGKVANAQGNWIGGDTILVQTGDIFDRGNDTIKIFKLLDKLRVQAKLVGGKVITHLGNHEMMNLIGDWRYVDQAEIDTFGDVATRYETITHGWLGQTIGKNYRITSRVPLHPAAGDINADFTPSLGAASNLSHAALSFVHGGLAFGYPDLTPYPSRINTLGASLVGKLANRTPLPEPYPPSTAKPEMPSTVTSEEIKINGVEGPYWARDWAEDETEEMCQQVEQVLDSIGCEKMLMGHTPLDYVMATRCDSKIVIIDTGISRGMLDSPSALEIIYTLAPTGIRRTWKETQVGTAFYRGSSETLWSQSQDVVGDFQQWH